MPGSSPSIRIEGHAIVTADGMIADAAGRMPTALRNDADWRSFQAALDAAALVVLGRKAHAAHPNPGRRRLVLTRSVQALAAVAGDSLATFWNPSGLPFDVVLAELGIASGVIAVTGGTGTFDVFLGSYDRFALAEVNTLVLTDGTPCFSDGHPRVMLARAGLSPVSFGLIDAGVTATEWDRRPS